MLDAEDGSRAAPEIRGDKCEQEGKRLEVTGYLKSIIKKKIGFVIM